MTEDDVCAVFAFDVLLDRQEGDLVEDRVAWAREVLASAGLELRVNETAGSGAFGLPYMECVWLGERRQVQVLDVNQAPDVGHARLLVLVLTQRDLLRLVRERSGVWVAERFAAACVAMEPDAALFQSIPAMDQADWDRLLRDFAADVSLSDVLGVVGRHLGLLYLDEIYAGLAMSIPRAAQRVTRELPTGDGVVLLGGADRVLEKWW